MHPGQLIQLSPELLRTLQESEADPRAASPAGAPHERALALAVALVAACAALVLALN